MFLLGVAAVLTVEGGLKVVSARKAQNTMMCLSRHHC